MELMNAVYVDTNIETYLVCEVSRHSNFVELKEQITREHREFYEHFGDITINSIKVKRDQNWYCISENMRLGPVFCGAKTWSVFASVSSPTLNHPIIQLKEGEGDNTLPASSGSSRGDSSDDEVERNGSGCNLRTLDDLSSSDKGSRRARDEKNSSALKKSKKPPKQAQMEAQMEDARNPSHREYNEKQFPTSSQQRGRGHGRSSVRGRETPYQSNSATTGKYKRPRRGKLVNSPTISMSTTEVPSKSPFPKSPFPYPSEVHNVMDSITDWYNPLPDGNCGCRAIAHQL